MTWDWNAPIMTVRVPRWKKETMADEPTPNKYNTATIVGLVGALLAVLDPFLKGAGVWIQAHSAIVFSDDYMGVLQRFLEVAVLVWATHAHGGDAPVVVAQATPPAEPPAAG